MRSSCTWEGRGTRGPCLPATTGQAGLGGMGRARCAAMRQLAQRPTAGGCALCCGPARRGTGWRWCLVECAALWRPACWGGGPSSRAGLRVRGVGSGFYEGGGGRGRSAAQLGAGAAPSRAAAAAAAVHKRGGSWGVQGWAGPADGRGALPARARASKSAAAGRGARGAGARGPLRPALSCPKRVACPNASLDSAGS
jgi:hypothetical protein